jgi:hypothetical protein
MVWLSAADLKSSNDEKWEAFQLYAGAEICVENRRVVFNRREGIDSVQSLRFLLLRDADVTI